MRDIEGDYRRALVAEHEAYKAAGLTERAADVAAVLRAHYGHDVEPGRVEVAKAADAPERADEKAPEDTAEPTPKRRGRPPKPRDPVTGEIKREGDE